MLAFVRGGSAEAVAAAPTAPAVVADAPLPERNSAPVPPDYLQPSPRNATSTVWRHVKLLAPDAPPAWRKRGNCICAFPVGSDKFCNTILRLSRNLQSKTPLLVTTPALNHLRNVHPGTDAVAAGAAAQRFKKTRVETGVERLRQGDANANGAHSPNASADETSALTGERMLIAQARFFVYAPQPVSKRLFDCEYLRLVLTAGDSDGHKTPLLTSEQLSGFVQAEFACFEKCIAFLFKKMHEEAKGNPFMQRIHADGELCNRVEYYAAGLQFIPPNFDTNLLVTVVFARDDTDDKEAVVAEKLRARVEALVGVPFHELVAGATADQAAARACVAQAPEATQPVEHSATRVTSRLRRLFSAVRAERALATHSRLWEVQEEVEGHVEEDDEDCALTPEWRKQQLRQFAAMLKASKHMGTLVGSAEHFVGAYVPYVLLMLEEALARESDASIELARDSFAVADLTDVGSTGLRRAAFELQRRARELDSHVAVGDERLVLTRRDKLAMLLDPRTKGATHLRDAERHSAREVLVEAMIAFERQCEKFDADKAKAEAAAAAVAAAVAAAAERAAAAPSRAAAAAPTAPSLPHVPTRGEPPVRDGTWTPPDEAVLSAAQAENAALARERRARVRVQATTWLCHEIDLAVEFPRYKVPAQADIFGRLIGLPLGDLFRGKLLENGTKVTHPIFGVIPLMASRSWGQVGALMEESFCERVLSCANDVLTEGDTLLDDEELDMLAILRMNAHFMKYMRQTYPEVGPSQLGRVPR